jgi:DNA-binding response OmpR family regulator
LTEKKLRVHWNIDPNLNNISANLDAQSWEHIIVNLINNAIIYCPINGIIEIEIKKEEHIVLLITDNGPGIHDHDLPNIFGYLNQGRTNKNPHGSGLGLFLVKELVTKHDGTITAFNKIADGKGACFRITLPFNPENETPTKLSSGNPKEFIELKSTYTHEEKTTSSQFKLNDNSNAPKILLVEDSTDFRDYLISGLQFNYQLETAETAERALEIIHQCKPDLMISDIVMHGMSGIELVKSIRLMDDFRTLPVIFLTGLDAESDIHMGLSAGADVYLTKPIKHQVVNAQIQALLRREKDADHIIDEIKSKHTELVGNAKQLIFKHMANKNLSIDLIANSLFISRATLYRKWNEENEVTIPQYIMQIRLREALSLLREKGFRVNEAAIAVGFADSSYFATMFKKHFGYSPSKLIRSGNESSS